MKQFQKLNSLCTAMHLGYIPFWLSEECSESAKEQLHKAYLHGGGWDPFKGFSLDRKDMSLTYPKDPPMKPFAVTELHGKEEVYIYPHAWVLILNKEDGDWEVCRMD